jgi:hypothetical protein
MFGVIGAFFFEKNNWAITVDSEHYCAMVQTSLSAKMGKKYIISTVWCNTPHSNSKHDLGECFQAT